ncbi:hypothetical protein [Hymenobacter cheonanensis]|uniref:hypothetical protein n=1 Tax=Hymenobacter sp. CA2-7 TaxID=3063993 RepID=UPI0027129568|nr:hypothetical protein [Hymenobacter sp. CA2-7]MDO7888246.1 hypothetical protein [Hymenobacter sp. CA2-7]
MNPFTTFLTSPWRWVLLGLAIVLAIAFGASGLNYASSWWARRGATKAVHATEAAHDTRTATEPRHQHHFDSTVWALAGQHRELARTLAKLQQLDDSLRNRLPAAPTLPAEPARY